jgi:hypothetical protein
VSLEQPPSPEDPPRQGLRVELLLAHGTVLGPTVIFRRELEGRPLLLQANRERTRQTMARHAGRAVDLQLVLHGSVANAPYAAVHHVRDYDRAPISEGDLAATPLLQLQPSTPGSAWHVAGQASARLRIELVGGPPRARLHVLR